MPGGRLDGGNFERKNCAKQIIVNPAKTQPPTTDARGAAASLGGGAGRVRGSVTGLHSGAKQAVHQGPRETSRTDEEQHALDASFARVKDVVAAVKLGSSPATGAGPGRIPSLRAEVPELSTKASPCVPPPAAARCTAAPSARTIRK